MEGSPNQEEILGLEKSRAISDGKILEDGASYMISESGKKELVLSDDQVERMRDLDAKYSVVKQEGKLEGEPLKDLSMEIDYLSKKERTQQILGGIDRFKNGLGIAIGIPALATFVGFGFIGGGAVFSQPGVMPAMLAGTAIYAAIGSIFTNPSFKEMANGVGMALKAVKGEKYEPKLAGYHDPNF